MIYKIIVDKQPSSNPSSEKKEYTIDIEELRTKGDVYDSLIITKDEDYVMRRLSLSELEVLTVLEEPIKEHLQDINIELFEGDNYIYIMDKTGNKFYAKYIVKNDFTDIYCTVNQMQSAIVQSAGQIELSVNQKLTDADNKIQEINGKLELKVDKDDNGQVVSMLNESADIIQIFGNRFILDSTNFKVSEEGNITATSGIVGGFTLGENKFSANLISEKMSKYTYTPADLTRLLNILVGNITPTSNDYDKYDFDYSGKFTSRDSAILVKIINGAENGQATFVLDTKNSEKAISIKKDDAEVVNLGVFGSYINYLSTGSINSSSSIITNQNFVVEKEGSTSDLWSYLGQGSYNGVTGGILGLYNEQNNNTISMYAQTGEINCISINPTSLEEQKKNIEKYTNNALETLKNIDIYKYNFKNEDDKTKKHLGFVIGDKYKYSEEVTSNENNGVDLYSFVSLCCKAIQEQQQEIEELRQEIQELKGGQVNG